MFLEDLTEAGPGFLCLALMKGWCEKSEMATRVVDHPALVDITELLAVPSPHSHLELGGQEKHVQLLSVKLAPEKDV